jgi:hypothetical protein
LKKEIDERQSRIEEFVGNDEIERTREQLKREGEMSIQEFIVSHKGLERLDCRE